MIAWPWRSRQLDFWDAGLLVVIGGFGIFEVMRTIFAERQEKEQEEKK